MLLATEIVVEETGDGSFRLQGRAAGERMDLERHEMIVDVKAVTMHEFNVEKIDGGWRAVVVLDI